MSFSIGIDVGGTFTDVVIQQNGEVHRGKADTTHYDLRIGFMNATRLAADKAGLPFKSAIKDAKAIVYSTTVGTNALIERRGEKLGLITTAGFEHTMHIGRARNWGDGLPAEKKFDRGRAIRPTPLIPQERIVGVQERIDSLGEIVVPLRDEEVLRKIGVLVDQGVRGFVVVLVNAHRNAKHERRIRELIDSQYPECFLGHMPVYLSHEISPKSGEYRRSMTVIVDAYIRDVSEGHLLRISDDLRDLGYERPVYVAKNTGGLSSFSRSQALHLLGSSPTATIVGAEHLGAMIGERNIIVTDKGGTTFDVGLVIEGTDRLYELDPVIDRFRVQVPLIAHWSIGAGGGSIARISEGELKVGPQSAGSNPGPVCYNRGGTQPTVTDADLVLGYINPQNFAGGRSKIDPALAAEAIRTQIAEPLGISVLDAAWNIKTLIDGYMGHEMYRVCALHSGQDPRDFVVFSLGGAGPLHAAGYADAGDVRRVATFPFSSVFGAFSTLTLDVLQTYERTLNARLYAARSGLTAASVPVINEAIAELLRQADRDMREEGFDMAAIRFEIEGALSYGQQRQTLAIKLNKYPIADLDDVRQICTDFNNAYRDKFGEGSGYPDAGIELVEVRINAVAPASKFVLQPVASDTGAENSFAGTRPAYWGPDFGMVETPIYRRDSMGAGLVLPGPVLCESEDTVIVTPPGWKFRVDNLGVGWIEKQVD
jgi:N-methylhydantoinase A